MWQAGKWIEDGEVKHTLPAGEPDNLTGRGQSVAGKEGGVSTFPLAGERQRILQAAQRNSAYGVGGFGGVSGGAAAPRPPLFPQRPRLTF